MKRNHLIATVGIGLTSLFALGATVSAAKSAPADLPAAKAKCLAAIDKRLATLSSLSGKVSGAEQLTDGHQSTLNSIISDSTSGITALRAEVEADTDAASLKEDCTAVAEQYRVYALRAPQVHYTIAADRAAAGLDKADAAVAKLQAAIDKAAAAGKDVTDETAKMAELQSLLADAEQRLDGLADTVLGFTPAQWNANHDLLGPTKSALQAIRTDLKSAVADAKAIIAGLKGA